MSDEGRSDGGRVEASGLRDWRRAARCRHEDPDALFVQGAQQRDVREVCRACPVRTECLAHALDNRIKFGVWGGMTERERRALLKRRPDVVSWSALLEAARRAALQRPGTSRTPGAPEPATAEESGAPASSGGSPGAGRAAGRQERRAG